MARKWMLLLCLMILVSGISGCAALQNDLGKLQADIQTQKANLIPKLQAGITYAQSVNDVEWATCLQGVLALCQSPAQPLPDISNPFIKVELVHQGSQAVQSGATPDFVQKINLACAAWYMREKVEIVKLGAEVATFIK